MRSLHPFSTLSVGLVTLGALACGDGGLGPDVARNPARLALTTLPSASARNRVAFATQPVVQLLDSSGNPVPHAGMPVIAVITEGGGSLGGTTTAYTGNSGAAAFTDLSITGTVGPRTLTFVAPGLTSATASVMLTAGIPVNIAANAGDDQVATPGGTVPIPPSVMVTDADANRVSGVAVTFAVVSGGGSITGPDQTTSASGIATVGTWTLGPTPSTNTLTATTPGLAPVTFTAIAAEGILDQQQLVYDGGTSARTLPGNTVWQSFTPSISGTLIEIDMGFFNDMSGSGQLQILSGDGTAGPVLQTLTVPVVGITQPGVTWNVWAVSVPVTAGLVYTFNFTPNAATLPDPYGVAIGADNPYPRGVMGLDDPSGSYRTDFDMVFRTFVAPSGMGMELSSQPASPARVPIGLRARAAAHSPFQVR